MVFVDNSVHMMIRVRVGTRHGLHQRFPSLEMTDDWYEIFVQQYILPKWWIKYVYMLCGQPLAMHSEQYVQLSDVPLPLSATLLLLLLLIIIIIMPLPRSIH